jgi:hypothetical protein
MERDGKVVINDLWIRLEIGTRVLLQVTAVVAADECRTNFTNIMYIKYASQSATAQISIQLQLTASDAITNI